MRVANIKCIKLNLQSSSVRTLKIAKKELNIESKLSFPRSKSSKKEGLEG